MSTTSSTGKVPVGGAEIHYEIHGDGAPLAIEPQCEGRQAGRQGQGSFGQGQVCGEPRRRVRSQFLPVA